MAQATSDDAAGFDDSFQPAARTGTEDDVSGHQARVWYMANHT